MLAEQLREAEPVLGAAGAQRYLMERAEDGFPEVRHTMRFPRAAGFTGTTEDQSSDVFARATLGGLLLDCAELARDDPAFRSAALAVARREADHVAAAKLRDRHGGWSYFPGLPELPPDVDSLAAALSLFTRGAPEHTALCEEPLRLALDGLHSDGGIETWIIALNDDESARRIMRAGVERCWGSGPDVDVCANFYHALLRHDPARHAAVLARGAEFILSRQNAEGSWSASWYWGRVYGLSLCLAFLRALGTGEEAEARALEYLRATQREDGGWGLLESTPIETAAALWALGRPALDAEPAPARRALEFLLSMQGSDGGWGESPWIKMEIGRAQGRVMRTATYQSATLTTAFCLRSLLLLGHPSRWA
jgi:squalene-hopene/tetraprenyl-beta-curcumene cyclase